MDLKSFRSRKHVTQQHLAAALGVSRSTVAMWENGTNEPNNTMLLNLAHYFSVSVDELLGCSSEYSPYANSLFSSRNQPCCKKTNDTRCSFSIRVKNLRERDGYTQSSLAKVLHVSQSTIGSWETQVREPTLKGISDLWSIFNTSADYLLGLTSNPSVPVSVPPSDFSLVSQLCTTYNLSDKARTMIETIIAMPPNKCEIIAEFAQQYTSLLDRNTPEDENKPFRRAADQLASDKENDGITKARA